MIDNLQIRDSEVGYSLPQHHQPERIEARGRLLRHAGKSLRLELLRGFHREDAPTGKEPS